MKAAYFTGNRGLELREVPDPTPGPDEVVVEIRASGICGTDLHQYRADKRGTHIAGHEPCGVVAARGTAVDARMAPDGARVMVHHYDGCRCCPNCLSGWTQLCDEGSVIYGTTGDGAHARYMKVPARTLVPLSEALGFVAGAAISCGTGTAFGALRRMGMTGGERVAIVGQGPVGLSATMIATAMGAEVIAVDISEARLDQATAFGTAHRINASETDPVAAVNDLTDGLGAPFVLECSGASPALATAVRATRKWGTCCFVGMGGDLNVNIKADVILRQVTMLGSWTFSNIGQKECADFAVRHDLPIERLFTHRYSLGEAEEAYRLFDTQTTGKMVLLPD